MKTKINQNRVILQCILTLEGGGAERQIAYLSQELSWQGWDVHVAFLRFGPNYELLKQSKVTLHPIPYKYHYDPRIIFYLVSLIREICPVIVQTWLLYMDIFAGLASWIEGVPHIISERSVRACYPKSLRTILRNLAGRYLSAGIVANSLEGLSYWSEFVPSYKPISVIPNIVPISVDESGEPSQSVIHQIPLPEVILYAGRFVDGKNLEILFPILEKILQQRPQCRAVLCGTGDQLTYWQQWVVERNLSNRIELPGYVTDLTNRLRNASVFVFPSAFEGQPNVVLEAMAAKCPLIVSDIAAHRAILDAESAVIIDPHDDKRFTEAIINTLDDRQSASQRATEAFKYIQDYTPHHIAETYIKFYQNVLHNSI